MNKIYLIGLCILCCLCCFGCEDDSPQGNSLVSGSFCFPASGGNLIDQLYASSEWRIQVSTRINFIRVTPNSGSGSPNPINLTIVANVNNDTDSRSAILELIIDGEVKTYSIFQDGTLIQTCTP